MNLPTLLVGDKPLKHDRRLHRRFSTHKSRTDPVCLELVHNKRTGVVVTQAGNRCRCPSKPREDCHNIAAGTASGRKLALDPIR